MITRISKVVFPPKTVGKPLRTTKLNLSISKIPYVNTMKKGFLCDQKIPYLQKFVHSIWNIPIDHQQRFNNRKPSILSQVVILLLLVSAVLLFSDGIPSKKSHQRRWNLSFSKVQSRFLDSNDEEKSDGHLCHRRNEEKHVEEASSDVTPSLVYQASTKLLELQEPNHIILPSKQSRENWGIIPRLERIRNDPESSRGQRGKFPIASESTNFPE